MFGYVTVFKYDLLVREFNEYKAVYCSLCKTLGKEYGVLTRFILSYDCTFYALLLRAMEKSLPCYEKKMCRFNPLKKCTYLKNSQDAMSKAAALSVTTVYYKIIDNIYDSKGIKKVLYKFLCPFFRHKNKKALERFPEICKAVHDMSERQIMVEKNPGCHIDMAAEPTAKMLSAVLALEAKSKNEKLILENLGYNLGRWIYLIDAADDLKEDLEKGNYNPFSDYKEKQDIKQYCNQVLNQCLANAYSSWQLLDVYNYEGIVDNILLKGLAASQNKVLFSEEKKKW